MFSQSISIPPASTFARISAGFFIGVSGGVSGCRLAPQVPFFEGLVSFATGPFSLTLMPSDDNGSPVDEPCSDKENTKPDTKLSRSWSGLLSLLAP